MRQHSFREGAETKVSVENNRIHASGDPAIPPHVEDDGQ